ncbi:MAG: hypothetical protein C0404_09020 [Verrucomicrobia bacterium]|nr:hypothetical protein [Verrucomicrobiota bacterium]
MTGVEARTDGELLKNYVETQDSAAFDALYERYAGLVYSLCYRSLRSHEDAQDAMTATFVVLLRKASALSVRASIGTWMHWCALKTAGNMIVARTRRVRREKESFDMQETTQTADADSLEGILPRIDAEVARLSARHREVIVMHFYQRLTVNEIAERVNRPAGTVASRMGRAIACLRERLGMANLNDEEFSSRLTRAGLLLPIPAAVASGVKTAVLSGSLSKATSLAVDWTLKSLLMAKVKILVAAAIIGGALAGGSWVAYEALNDRESRVPENAEVIYSDDFKSGLISEFWVKAEPRECVSIKGGREPALQLLARSEGDRGGRTFLESKPVEMAGCMLEVYLARSKFGLQPGDDSSARIVLVDQDGHDFCTVRIGRNFKANTQEQVRKLFVKIGDGDDAECKLGSLPGYFRIYVESSGEVRVARSRKEAVRGDFFATGIAGGPIKSFVLRLESVSSPGGENTAAYRNIAVTRFVNQKKEK